jgi:mannitol-specific phosphotransferase system IIBC component
MKPSLILAAIGGGVTGTFFFTFLGGGLKAAASPGSIIAILIVSAKDAYVGNIIGVAWCRSCFIHSLPQLFLRMIRSLAMT